MGKKIKGQKRKKSSDTGADKLKAAKHGGHSSGLVKLDNGDQERSSADSNGSVNVSDLLKSANDVLFDERPSISLDISAMSNTSVFEAADDNNGGAQAGVESDVAVDRTNKEPTNSDLLTILVKMDTKMTSIEGRLRKLESLEKKVDKVDREMQKLWTYIHDQQKAVDDRLNRLEEKHDGVQMSVGLTNDKIVSLEKQRNEMAENLVYLQSQSMRNNLLFTNIDEAPNEVPEQTEQALRRFMVDKLKMAQTLVDGIAFERVHRMGPRDQRSGHRTIVAKFTMFKDRETVRKLRGNLRQTGCYINEQFPKEVADRRKALRPKMREAIQSGKRAWIAYDKLYIDGRVVNDAGH